MWVIFTCNALQVSCMCYNYVHVLVSMPIAGITWSDLVTMKPWLDNQTISGFIALHPNTICDNFANLLLQDSLVVGNIRSENKSNNSFVDAVLTQWFSSTGTSVPFTWRDLIQCMKDAGLNSHTVQIIEDNVLDEMKSPSEFE